MITAARIKELYPGASDVLLAAIAPVLETDRESYHVVTARRVAHFIAQFARATKGFTLLDDPARSCRLALARWDEAGCNRRADFDDVEGVTRRFTGQVDGIPELREDTRRALASFGVVAGLPKAYGWLPSEPGPKMVVEALRHYGVHETPGTSDAEEILSWAKELGIKEYVHDAIPWCGLFMALVARRTGKSYPDKPLWASNWKGFGEKTEVAMLGDVLVFERRDRAGHFIGGHVGLYVGESESTYHVLGGNEADQVNIVQILKTRCIGIRRPSYTVQPKNVRRIFLLSTGEVSSNEQLVHKPSVDRSRLAGDYLLRVEGYRHWCPGCETLHTISNVSPEGWTFDGNLRAPSFAPDFLILGPPRCHYSLHGGKIAFAPDSEHALKGKTVAMEPMAGHLARLINA